MNILMISLDRGVAQKGSSVLNRIIKEYKEDTLHILVPHSEDFQNTPHERVHVLGFGGNKMKQFFSILKSGRKIVQSNHIDLITVQDPFFIGFIGLLLRKKRNIPVEVQVHGDFFGSEYYRRGSLWNRLRYLLGKMVIKKAEKIRVVSQRIAESIRTMEIKKEKISIRPIKVDTHVIQAHEPKINLHSKYSGFEKIFLVLGRLEKEKNISWLIDVFSEVLGYEKNYLLLIVGRGSEKGALQAQVKRLGLQEFILFEGWTDDPYSYLKTADCLLFPSLAEGYGMVVIEALSAGCPVIMSDVGVAGHEVQSSASVTIVSVGDTEAFLEAICPEAKKQSVAKERKKGSEPLFIRGFRFVFFLVRLWLDQNASPDVRKKRQEKKLQKILRHVYIHVPFYRKKFDELGLRPEDIKTVQDLQKLPTVEKKDIREARPEDVVSDMSDPEDCIVERTTGSTAEPFSFCYSERNADYAQALVYFAFFECGLSVRDTLVELSIPFQPMDTYWFRKIGLLKNKLITINQPTEDIIEELQKIKRVAIYTYPSVLLLIAKEIESKHIPLKNIRLLFTLGEVLEKEDREYIERVFGVPVYDTYGSTEFRRLAFECPKKEGYHLITESAVVEVLEDGEPVPDGEEGKIVVTSLYHEDMPFIRYKLGDLVIKRCGLCSCGRKSPLIKNIVGRKDDWVVLPSGRRVSPRSICNLDEIQGVKKFRIIQKNRNTFEVLVVPEDSFSDDTAEEMEREIRSGCFGERVDIHVTEVNDIPREGRGKYRKFISEVEV
ncbi:MAG: glycosyltransferase [Candidatus Magasanikbacteria bacterium]